MKNVTRYLRSVLCGLFVLTVLQPHTAAADTLTLMWDLNTEPDVTGYQVHVGQQPGVYTQVIDVGNTDTFVFTDAAAGQQYCFVVTAYAGSVVSPFSAEVCGGGGGNAAPYLSQPFNQANTVGQAVSLQLSGGDPDGSPITYSASGLPPGLSLSASTGLISGTLTTPGAFSVTVSVSDGALSTSRTFSWMVNATNRAPILANPGGLLGTVGQAVMLQLQATDPDGQTLAFSATGLPTGLSIASNTGVISGTPSTTGTFNVVATASDGSLSATQSFTWTIRSANRTPTLVNPGRILTAVGAATSLQMVASDPDGDVLTFAASGVPPGLQISTSTGLISGTPTVAATYTIVVTVTDGTLLATQTFTWTVRPNNTAPVLTNPGNQSTVQGQPVVLQLAATDPEGDVLTFSATGLPAGLSISATTGRVSGTPTTTAVSSVTVTVNDGGLTATQSFTWTVRAPNSAPALTNPGNQTTDVNTAVNLQLQATDVDGDTLSFQANGLPAGLSIASSTGRITGTPTAVGTYTVTANAADGSLVATQTFTWTIRTTNTAPILTQPANQTGDVNQPVVLNLQAQDANGDALTFSATGLPTGLTINTTTGRIAGTPTVVGVFNVSVTVSDGSLSASRSFTWTIRAVNNAPVLADPTDQVSHAGQPATLQLQATDANGDAITYGASGLPSGMALTPATGLIAGTPTVIGVFSVTVTASDGVATATQTLTWTIDDPSAANGSPTMTNPGTRRNNVGDVVSLQVLASDPDGDTLTFSAGGLPPGLAINSSTGLISGTPVTPGNYSVMLSAFDGALTVTKGFTWIIRAVNIAPTLLDPGPQTDQAGGFLALQLQGADVNGDTLVYSATGLPPGLQLATSTGVISGVPATAGTYSVTASVTDGTASASRTFTWTIDPANVAPTLTSPGNQTSVVGQSVVLQLQGSDADGDTLTYSATGLPTGLTITSSTGAITGTSTTAGTFGVIVRVSDGVFTTQRSFTWTVQAANVAPTLSNPGNQTGIEGQFVSLQLQGSDNNGDALGYTASGLPTGLVLMPSTGLISGTPTAPGTFNVVVSVSDGALSATRSFTWTIQASNVAPTLVPVGNQVSVAGQATTLQLQGNDADGGTLTYSANGLPTGLALTPSTGQIAGTPTTPGTFTVTVSVNDGALSATRSFLWTITAANVAPVLTNPGNQTATAGQFQLLQLLASDANHDTIVYAATGLPPGLQLATLSGRISGTPVTPGTYSVVVTASDGALNNSQSFTWTVVPANVAPVLVSPGNQASTLGDLIALQIVASDVNGDRLTFSAAGLPPGLQISQTTGIIGGTASVTGAFAVNVSVSDGALTASQAFGWNVAVPPPPSTLTGSVAVDPTPETQTTSTTRRTASASTATGTTAVVRSEPITPTTTRQYVGSTARERIVTPTAPPVDYTGGAAVVRSIDAAPDTRVYSGAATTRNGATVGGSTTGSMTTSESTTRSIANEETAETSQAIARDTTVVNGGQVPTGALATSTPAPTITIETPVDRATFASGSLVHFMATASEAAGGDISGRIIWTSDVDGVLGNGGSITKVLSSGTHVVSATVTNSRGRASSARITVIVE